MIKYRLSMYGLKIRAVDVISDDADTISAYNEYGNVRVEKKQSNISAWFNTWDDAKEMAVSVARMRVSKAESHLQSQKASLDAALALVSHEPNGE